MSVKIVVIGASGFIGKAFAHRLAQLSHFHVEPQKVLPIGEVVLVSRNITYYQDHPTFLERSGWRVLQADLVDIDTLRQALQPSSDEQQVVVYLFAAVISGDAESNFELGLQVNIHAPMALLKAMHDIGEQTGHPLILVYTSSIYVACLNDENRRRPFSEERFRLSPASYGVQKACMELLICDYARHGFVDGRVARVPAIIGRPEFFNSQSITFSMIFTQTLTGKDYKVPLPMESSLPCSGLENNVECLLQLGGKVSGHDLGHNRVVQVPARTYSLTEIWEATQAVAKQHGIQLGSIAPIDPNKASTTFTQMNIVPCVDFTRSERLGLPQDIGLESIINKFIIREGIKK